MRYLLTLIIFLMMMTASYAQPKNDPNDVTWTTFSPPVEMIFNTAELIGWDKVLLSYLSSEFAETTYIGGSEEEIMRFREAMWAQERNFHVIRFVVDGITYYKIPEGVPCNHGHYCGHYNFKHKGVLMVKNGLDNDGNVIDQEYLNTHNEYGEKKK